MNIPDEAVEAAHRAWREQSAQDGSIFEHNLRAALEAAAPHMTRPDAEIVKEIHALLRAYQNGEIDADQFVVYAAGTTLRKKDEEL